MTKPFNLTDDDLRELWCRQEWKRRLRQLELRLVLGRYGAGHFERALELGCGSGEHTKHLARCCGSVAAVEYNAGRLSAVDDEKTTFLVGDACDLSRFGDGEMDLVFSSNLLEHLPDVGRCLAECRRVAGPDGLIIHTVPNRAWKLFSVMLYYPYRLRGLAARLLDRGRAAGARTPGPRLNNNLDLLQGRPSVLSRLLPKVHGVSRTNVGEFLAWGRARWLAAFRAAGLVPIRVLPLPFYFAYAYDFMPLLRFGNRLGLSASTAYVLRRAAVPAPAPHSIRSSVVSRLRAKARTAA